MKVRTLGQAARLAAAVALCACADGGPTAPPGATLEVAVPWSTPVRLSRPGEPVPLRCVVRLADGSRVDVSGEARVSGRAGVLDGSTCDRLAVRRSGVAALKVAYQGLARRVEVAVALPPVVLQPPLGEWLQADRFPAAGHLWAPSARRNSRGQMEVYVTGYLATAEFQKGTLHRYVSDDGRRFRYDGVVLRPTEDRCTPMGDGIENVVVVPRAEARGWRMFLAAGSNVCHGWQIHSAVSDDERSWRLEAGVRIGAGGGTPAGATPDPYWAQGEGMFVDRLPDGTWRMLQGGMEPKVPGDLVFNITEWRSRDQLHWSYAGTVLTPRGMPPGGGGAVYSPALREFAPGLHRMIFTADDRGAPGARSRLWSAVSRDLRAWQVEGELLGAPGSDLWYSALVGERLVFIRRDRDADGPGHRLAVATVQMP